MGERDDFVEVKLSAKGEEIAAGGPLRICGGKYEFCFVAGESQAVTAGEWKEILSRERRDGQAVFEIALSEDLTIEPSDR